MQRFITQIRLNHYDILSRIQRYYTSLLNKLSKCKIEYYVLAIKHAEMFSTKIYASCMYVLCNVCSEIKLWKYNNKITVVVCAVALKYERNYISMEWLHKQISINVLTNSLLSQEKWAISIDYRGDASQMRHNGRLWCYYALKMRITKSFSPKL